MATLKDVAALAEVSTSTASRVLHGGKMRVSEVTRARIAEAAEQLKYRPNATARSLRTRITRIVGLMIPDIQNPVYAQIIAGAEDAGQKEGFAVMLMNSTSRSRREQFLDLFAEGRLDGLIIADATLDDASIDQLVARRLNFVLVNRRTRQNVPYVVLDESAGAAMAIHHLYELGHRHIGYLAGPPQVDTAILRLEGVKKECAEAGIAFPPERMRSCGFNGEGVEAALDYLLSVEPRITALATANIVIAFAALRHAQIRGLKVPDDLSIIGYHDTPLAEFTSPGLTTVDMPLWDLGRHAMDHMLAKVGGLSPTSEIITNPRPRIVVRGSTAPPGSH